MTRFGGAKAANGLYLVTDRRACENLGSTLLESVRAACEAGVRFVQLREKDLDGAALLALAREIREVTSGFGAKLIINGRVDVAILSGADGVHLGRKSVGAQDARKLLGNGALIGVSTHSVEEAVEAEANGADFITFGPVFHTPSKAAWGEPVGLGLLEKAACKVSIPVYAIGGIKAGNIEEVISAGAAGIAVISAVLGEKDVKGAAQSLLEALRKAQRA